MSANVNDLQSAFLTALVGELPLATGFDRLRRDSDCGAVLLQKPPLCRVGSIFAACATTCVKIRTLRKSGIRPVGGPLWQGSKSNTLRHGPGTRRSPVPPLRRPPDCRIQRKSPPPPREQTAARPTGARARGRRRVMPSSVSCSMMPPRGRFRRPSRCSESPSLLRRTYSFAKATRSLLKNRAGLSP
jgi:hypothetical protein